ncbi:MAG: hypothetical protein K2M06_01185, partial [Muribaculaceae bacterium]|nr:hypothetical protein [Muribaculaceae bacterium]
MKFIRTSCFAALALAAMSASADIPVKILNNSNGDFADDEVYIGILGQIKTNYIYYDLQESASQKRCVIHTLDESVNRLHATEGDWGYADIFTKLSDIPDNTFYIGDTFACRMFIAFKSPMYLHAFPTGYAGADMNNPNDPNAKVRWELIEFTYEPEIYDGQIWINHTRVDAFQYPMGLELYATGNRDGSRPYTKRGEIVNYRTVIDRWNSAYASTPYKDCYYNLIEKDNLGGIIKQPSKVESVKHAHLFDDYINKIWDYFRTNEANINMGILGRWTGRVQGDAFILTCAEGTYWEIGSTATVNKPTTEDAIEGAGPFAEGSDRDKTVQSMFCSAFNRGQFRAQTAEQNWDPENGIKPFQGGTEYPCNEYVKFFHDTAISASDGKTYAFAYDDTYDQSATCYTTAPTAVTVTLGGFANGGGGGEENPNPNPTPNPDPQPDPVSIPAAPAPEKSADLVKSFFSDAYASISPNLVFGSWGQSTKDEIVALDGNNAYKFSDFNYLGLQVSGANDVVNVSDMAYLHLDLYAPAEMDINIYPISLNPTVDGDKATKHLTAGEWNSFDIALSDFPNVNLESFGQFKMDGGNGQTFYLDNLYMWRENGSTPVDPD